METKTSFEMLSELFDDLMNTPTLDALAKKCREYNQEYEIAEESPRPCLVCGAYDGDHDPGCTCGKPYYDPSDDRCCPQCHWSDCHCGEPQREHDERMK